jgi:tripartite-type tricarboxylate transporter receptor subunit TctC
MRSYLHTLGAAALTAASTVAISQDYPTKPLRLVVPIVPGGSVDIVARRMSQKVSDSIGQPVVVENIAGASGTIGSALVARAVPDGYTYLFATAGEMIAFMFLTSNRPYDPIKDFTPLMLGVSAVSYLLAGPSSPVSSVEQLVDYARRNPGKLTYGSAGIGSTFHLLFEVLKNSAQIDVLHVPYKGVPPSLNAVAAGQVHLVISSLASAKPVMSRVKVLATVENQRYARGPSVPTVSEIISGYQKLPTWFSYFAPAGLPRAVQLRLNGELNKALEHPDVREYNDTNGLLSLGGTAEELADNHRKGIEIYARVIKQAGIKPE